MFGFASKTVDYSSLGKCAGARYTTPKGPGTLDEVSRDGRLAIRLDSGDRDWFRMTECQTVTIPGPGQWRDAKLFPIPKDAELLIWVVPYQTHPEVKPKPQAAHVRWEEGKYSQTWRLVNATGPAVAPHDVITHWMYVLPPA